MDSDYKHVKKAPGAARVASSTFVAWTKHATGSGSVGAAGPQIPAIGSGIGLVGFKASPRRGHSVAAPEVQNPGQEHPGPLGAYVESAGKACWLA